MVWVDRRHPIIWFNCDLCDDKVTLQSDITCVFMVKNVIVIWKVAQFVIYNSKCTLQGQNSCGIYLNCNRLVLRTRPSQIISSGEESPPEKVGELVLRTRSPTFSGGDSSPELIIVNSTFDPSLTVHLDIILQVRPKKGWKSFLVNLKTKRIFCMFFNFQKTNWPLLKKIY